MTNDKKSDIIIIGAGVAGSSLAAVLAASGWRVALLERDHFPRHKVCGEFLSPEAQTILDRLGLYRPVQALSPTPLRQVKLVSGRGVTAQAPLPGPAWGVSRYALDAALAAAAGHRGVDLHPGVTATQVRPLKNGYAVTTRSKRDRRTWQARAVIAACGRHTAARLPPFAAPHDRPAYVGLKCHYEGVTMPAQVELFFFRGGYLGINPIEGRRVNVCLLADPAAFARAGGKIPAMIEMVAARQPALARRLERGRALPETEAAVAPVDPYRPPAPWADMACVGDAAAMIPPLCGDGMAMALQAAGLCAPLADEFLRGRLTWAEWQETYRTAWHAAFDRPLRLGRRLQTILNLPVLSDGLIGVGRLAPALTGWFIRATRSQ